MSNMSYCRFQNTRTDLRDCLDAIEDCKDLSDEEYRAAVSMFNSMCEFLCDYGIIPEYDAEIIEDMLDPLHESF